MSRRTLINLLLFALAGLLGLLVWWLQPQPLPALTSLSPEQVERIRISHAGGEEILLIRRSDGWSLDGAPANTDRIEQLLGICATPSLRRFAVPTEDLRQFGLDRPVLRLWLNDLVLSFGTTDPVHGWRYVRLGETIHLIGDGFHHHLNAAADEFLERP